MLESTLYEDNAFVTLSYDEKNHPKDGSVSKEELQNFLKRLRARMDYYAEKEGTEPRKVRYFGVGEYGSKSLRPHYHLILFDYPSCIYRLSQYGKRRASCCAVCDTIRDVWGRGHVFLGEVSFQSAAYVAGYVVKGWTRDVPEHIAHLDPEFTLKSNRPGIGHDFAWELASSLLFAEATHVPFSVRHNGRLWPLGRYIRSKVAEFTGGLELEKAPLDQRVHELSEVIYNDTEVLPKQKTWKVREALIAPRYHKAKALEKKLDKSRKDHLI